MTNKKYAAVIVETRNLPNLKEIIADNHLRYLPENWDCIVFCSEANKDKFNFLPESKGETSVLVDDNENLNQAEYNKILASVGFWEQLAWYDKVLIFQHDSKLLRTGIEEFLEWDYVGAPWTFQDHGGNSGLAIRSPKSMLDILKDFKYNYPASGNEDVFISNVLHDSKKYGKLAPRDVCEKFSCEAIFKLGTLGYHAIDKYLSEEECGQIENQYKEVSAEYDSFNKIQQTNINSFKEAGYSELKPEVKSETYLDEENKAKVEKEIALGNIQIGGKTIKPEFNPEINTVTVNSNETAILEKIYSEMCETKKLLQLLVRKEKQGSAKGLFNDEEELVIYANAGKQGGLFSSEHEPFLAKLPKTEGLVKQNPSQETIDKAKQEISLMYKQACEKPSDINEHLSTIRRYAEGLEVIEMGTRDVVSSWAFLDSAKKIICYDILKHKNVNLLEKLASEADKDFQFIENDVLKVEIPECDLLFIDTLHIYSQLKEELRLHGNKARKYLVFHDYVSYGNSDEPISWQPEVVKPNYKAGDKQGLMPAIMEFLMDNPNWSICERFENNNGLLILQRS